MKKKALVVIVVSALLTSAVAEIELVGLAWANPLGLFSFTAPPDILFYSPLNKTYTGNVLLNFTVIPSKDWVNGVYYHPEICQELKSVDYHIDGSLQGSIAANSNLTHPFRYSANLTDLQEGSHCLIVETISTGVEGGYMFGDPGHIVPADSAKVTVYFSIADDGFPPRVSLLSAENKTYSTSNITLAYSINDQVVNALYSLDRQESVSLSGNTTLTDLPEGSHDITVYAYDRAGNKVSETVHFTISMPEPFPTTLIIGSVIVVAVVAAVCLGLLVYLKKRGRGKTQ
jgi:hypothetical protein